MSEDDLQTYNFQGNDGEIVPVGIEKLIVNPGVRILPDGFCYCKNQLRQVTLPEGLTGIGNMAFQFCRKLLKIRICSTVQFIGISAFNDCGRLTKVEFENLMCSPHQLRRIDERAFSLCKSLQRMKLPSSVTCLGRWAFQGCRALKEANLSETCVAEIPNCAFAACGSLLTVSVPNTLERIGDGAFWRCSELVTVVLPHDSQSISIGIESFLGCRRLANIVLPKNSTAQGDSFTNRLGRGNQLLREVFGEDSSDILAGLIGRFEDFPVHRMCYDHATTTPEQLRQCVEEQGTELLLVDEFGMTVFHVLFSTIGPSTELLQVLLNAFPRYIIGSRDANGKRPMDYLIKNWTDATTATLLQMSLQKWMIDPTNEWVGASCQTDMESKVHSLLFEVRDQGERAELWTRVQSSFEYYEIVESSSILELALWNSKLRSARRNNDSSKRQARDRGECRCISGSDVVIPQVLKFLDIA